MQVDRQPQAGKHDDEARQRLAAMTHLMRGWVWETDAEHRFNYMSPSVEIFAGTPPEWYYGKTREEIDAIDFKDARWGHYRAQLAARIPFGPLDYARTIDGKAYWRRTMGMPLFDAEQTFLGYRGIALDVTAEVEARLAKEAGSARLEQSLATLEATIASFPGAISVFDQDMRLAHANAAYYEMLSLPRAKFPIGVAIETIFAFLSQRGEFIGNEMNNALRHRAIAVSGNSHVFERVRPNGRRIEVRSEPMQGGGFVRTYLDITDRQEQTWQLQGRILALKARVAELELQLQMPGASAEMAGDLAPTPVQDLATDVQDDVLLTNDLLADVVPPRVQRYRRGSDLAPAR